MTVDDSATSPAPHPKPNYPVTQGGKFLDILATRQNT